MSKQVRNFSRIEVEASEWLAIISDRPLSRDQRTRFESWLSANPEHRRIYQVQKLAWSAVARMPELMSPAYSPRVTEAAASNSWTSGRKMWLGALAAALALIALGVAVWNPTTLFRARESYETAVGQVRDIKLSDGSVITLGAASHVDVDWRQGERRVVLTRGEAFFNVSHDSVRPFFVTAGSALVRVVGTKFDVHYGQKSVRVAVAEGRVEVMQAPAGTTPATPFQKQQDIHSLTAGEAAVAESSGQIAATDAVKQEDLGAWRSGRLVYVDAHLRDVIADINRYYAGKIEVADEATGDMQLTTAFRVEQVDRMLQVLQSAIPVSATYAANGHVILGARATQH